MKKLAVVLVASAGGIMLSAASGIGFNPARLAGTSCAAAEPCAVLDSTPPAAAANQLTNGDFETGQMTGWESTGPAIAVQDEVVYQGRYAAHVAAAAQASQGWISVVPGRTYVASAWFKWDAMSDDDWGYSHFKVNDSNWQDLAALNELDKHYPPGAWHKLALTFTPAANQIMVVFGVFGPETVVDFYFDALAVIEKTANLPPVIAPRSHIAAGAAPLTVHFTAQADDLDGAVELHRWQFGDGAEAREPNPTHTYLSGGDFVVTYTAYDQDGASASQTLAIAVSDPRSPAIAVSAPTTDEAYTTTQASITIAGQAQSGTSPITSLVWDNINRSEAGQIEIVPGLTAAWTTDVPLKPGSNEILITATDADGRVGARRLFVTRRIPGPSIANIAVNTLSPRVYERYEVTFDVETVADYPLFTYDPSPPPGAEGFAGVSVDGIITTPSGQVVTHPAFYMVETILDGGRYYPTSNQHWALRLSPLEPGIHQVTLQVTDSSGTHTAVVGSFEAQAPINPGFVRVSQSDPRYFEYTGGGLFWPIGLTWSGSSGTTPDGIDLADSVLNYDRPWMGGLGAYSTNWARWISSAEQHGNEGVSSHLSFTEHYPSSRLSQHLHYPDGFRMWIGCWLDDMFCADIRANTAYQVTLRVKTTGLSGPRNPAYPFGLVIKNHDWLGLEPPASFDAALRDTPSWITPIRQDTDWHTVVAPWVATSDADHFSIYLENVTGGAAFVDQFSIRERLPDGRLGPELIRNPRADLHTYVEQRPMAYFDHQVAAGEQNGVHLRYVVQDKNDWIPNHLDSASGVFVQQGDGYYQPEHTLATWLQKQWWRYLVARLGYSTAVFGWELNNEGPPDDGTGAHARHAQLFARFMHDLDAHPHLASTSFWCCWEPSFWGDHQRFPDIDFADIHHYGSPTDMVQWYLDDALPAFNDQVGKPIVRGETGIIDGDNTNDFTAALTQPNPGIWYHNLLWSQLHYSSMFDIGYWFPEHITGFSREDHARPFFNFVRDLDINQGGYQDIEAASDDSRLRILGQKNLQTNQAYAWINHRDHTWKAVMDRGIPPAVSAQVVFQMNPGASYRVTWYSPYSGEVLAAQIVAADASGRVALAVTALSSDMAFKLSPAPP